MYLLLSRDIGNLMGNEAFVFVYHSFSVLRQTI